MAANGGSVAIGRTVPAIPVLAGAQSKASQRVGASWPFVLHGGFPCRKDRFIPLSLCQRSSHRLRTKLTSAMPSCTSSNQSGRGQPFPRASTTAFRCVSRILLITMPRGSTRHGSHRMPTACDSCATIPCSELLPGNFECVPLSTSFLALIRHSLTPSVRQDRRKGVQL